MHTAAVVQMHPLPCGNRSDRFADGESILDDVAAFGQRVHRDLVACVQRLRSPHFEGFTITANEDERAGPRIAKQRGNVVVGVDPKCICSRFSHSIP